MTKHALLPFTVTHKRNGVKSYVFTHKFFWFKINLKSINGMGTSLVSHNKLNLYSFHDSDHLRLGEKGIWQNYVKFAKNNGVSSEITEISIYTNLRSLGYVFNPVSFVLLNDENNQSYAIIEVGNTFNEVKPFFVDASHFNNESFSIKTKKFFYISPFIPHDYDLTFNFKKDSEKVTISVFDDGEEGRVLEVYLNGKEIPLTTSNLLINTLRIPFITLKVIGLIHLHAFILWFKGIRYFKKSENQNLQKGYYIWKE